MTEAKTFEFESAEGFPIAADIYGDPSNDPILFMHGGGQTRHAWGGAAAALAKRGWYTISMDHRGHGDSGWSPSASYELDDFTADFHAVQKQIGRKAVVCGASLGGRTALMNGRIQSSASIYQIIRSNVLQADPRGDAGNDGVNDFVSFGEVTSEGFEADITADITPNWVGTASYAYNDTVITGDAGTGGISNRVGDRFANAPEHTFGFWTRYQFPQFNTAVAFGGDYVDVRQSLSGQKVRPYVVFDASLIYEVEDWRALVRIDNVFDETYAVSGFISRTGHFPGEPRSIFLELTRTW